MSLRDGMIIGLLPLQLLVAWCLPERLWRRCARLLLPVAELLYVKGGSRTESLIRTILVRHLGPRLTCRKIVQELAAEEFVSILQILRDYRPGGWRPRIELIGSDHLVSALKGGNGAILWICYTHGAKLVAKMAIHRAGYMVAHLSRPRHGLSPTRFGIRWLNRIQTTIENRYISERIVIKDGEFQRAVRCLIARLKANKIISITVHRDAIRPTTTRFLDGEIVLADGACALSNRTGAALLPVFAYRDSGGMLTVTIDPPLDTHQAHCEADAVSCAHRDYVKRLEKFVQTYPGQWRGWYQLL